MERQPEGSRSREREFVEHEQRDRDLFNRIAASYGRKDLTPSSQVARRRRIWATLELVPFPPGARILDVGCGAGFGATYLKGKFGSYVGIDHAENLITFAKARNTHTGTRFIAVNARAFESSEPFDLVFMIGVLHHMADRAGMLAHLRQLIAPGGWLVVNEPQPANPIVRWARRCRTRLDASYSSDQEELSVEELSRDFLAAGFSELRTRGQGLFSTPFAEVVLKPQSVAHPLARAAVWLDRQVEAAVPHLMSRLSWNVIVAGRR